MYFNKFKLYKHKNNTDVAIRVESEKEDEGIIHLKVCWYNVVNKNNIFLIDNDEIIINEEDVSEWKVLNVH